MAHHYEFNPADSATTPVNPGLGSLSVSSNAAAGASGYQQWFKHYQVIWGMWRRVWQYESELTQAGGVLSGPPKVSFNYVDVRVNSKVLETLEYMNWTSSLQEPQILNITTDSSLSGYGLSGTFATVVAGVTLDVAKKGDTASACTRAWNVQAGYQPGEYSASSDDYSAFASDFFSNVVLGIPDRCVNFLPDLVKI